MLFYLAVVRTAEDLGQKSFRKLQTFLIRRSLRSFADEVKIYPFFKTEFEGTVFNKKFCYGQNFSSTYYYNLSLTTSMDSVTHKQVLVRPEPLRETPMILSATEFS